jgi:hypothetical protein
MSGTKRTDWISKIDQNKVDINNLGSDDKINYGDFFPIMEWLSNNPKLTQKIFVTNLTENSNKSYINFTISGNGKKEADGLLGDSYTKSHKFQMSTEGKVTMTKRNVANLSQEDLKTGRDEELKDKIFGVAEPFVSKLVPKLTENYTNDLEVLNEEINRIKKIMTNG